MKKTLKLVALLIALVMVFTLVLVACDKDCGAGNHTDENHDGVCEVCKKATAFKHVDADGDRKCDVCKKAIVYTFNDYLSVTPSNWNELDYADSNDTNILGWIVSAFFEYDYDFGGQKFNADGSINFDGIVDESFTVTYSAATALEDVTETYGNDWELTSEQISEGGYIWKITLRQDLKWDDGTPIKAEDFVYTMEQQLDPDFQLTRADTYYANAVKIHNAKNYLYQGQGTAFANLEDAGLNPSEIDEQGQINGRQVYIDAVNFWGASNIDEIEEIPGVIVTPSGSYYVPISEDTVKLDDGEEEQYTAKGVYEYLLSLGTDYVAFYCEVVVGSYPDELDFDKVGIFAPSDYEIVLVLDQPQEYFKEDGETLSYYAAYNLSSLPLVKKDLYESCKKAPQSGSTLWTTTYNTSLETSASWGPYKLTFFQAGRQYILEKNEYWYGWNLPQFAGQYQADRIVTDIIAQEEAARLAFWAGNIDGLGIDVTIADDYKNSDYALYTPSSGTTGIQIYSNLDVLKTSGRNNGILAITEFRKALSLALNRQDYNRTVSTANQPCLGMMNNVYYYDIENALTYRGSDEGKQALLRSYGFSLNEQQKWTDGENVYDSIDDAYDAMTGYNLPLAKQLLEEAYQELTQNAEKYGYDPTKNIVMKFGTSADNASSRRYYNYFVNWLSNLTAGTSLAGKVELVFDSSFGTKWADAFMDGEYEFCTGGFSGAALDPFYMIGSNLNIGSLTYHPYWETDKVNLTITLPAGDYERAGEEVTLTVTQWYHSLNGSTSESDFRHNWGPSSNTPTEVRLLILAALEEYALGEYHFIPATAAYSASLHSAKWSYASDTYNTLMGFGGLQYMQFHYADDEWAAFVKATDNGDLRNFYKG